MATRTGGWKATHWWNKPIDSCTFPLEWITAATPWTNRKYLRPCRLLGHVRQFLFTFFYREESLKKPQRTTRGCVCFFQVEMTVKECCQGQTERYVAQKKRLPTHGWANRLICLPLQCCGRILSTLKLDEATLTNNNREVQPVTQMALKLGDVLFK